VYELSDCLTKLLGPLDEPVVAPLVRYVHVAVGDELEEGPSGVQRNCLVPPAPGYEGRHLHLRNGNAIHAVSVTDSSAEKVRSFENSGSNPKGHRFESPTLL
jgi:hypothetical protein